MEFTHGYIRIITKAAENMFMEQTQTPPQTEVNPSAVADALDRLYRKTMEDYLGMVYDERIGWYSVDGEIIPRLIVKRDKPNDESAN